jgi:UDP-2,3-diacylglucosamine pyrophosphatase LpxH
LSDRVETIWLCGNHDGSAEVVSHLLGVTVMNEYSLKTGERRILVLHGHVFDDFLDAHPILTWLGDCVYAFLQWLDRSHAIARLAKHGSKTFLRCARKVEERSTAYARARGYDAVCCGHTHLAQAAQANGVEYFNSGCWTEVPCTYLTVADGCVELQQFEPTFTEYSAQDSDAAYAV